jgi:hypothetical protein
MNSKDDHRIFAAKFLDALDRGAAAAYNDPIQRAVLDEAIRQGSYVAKSRSAGSTNTIYGTPIRDGFAAARENEATK